MKLYEFYLLPDYFLSLLLYLVILPIFSLTICLPFIVWSIEREQEIKALKQSSEDARAQNLQLATALLQLREQEQQLDQDQEGLQEENNKLKAEADALWMLPALFGVTPLDMVNITLRQDQEEEEEEGGLHLLDNT